MIPLLNDLRFNIRNLESTLQFIETGDKIIFPGKKHKISKLIYTGF